MSKTKKLFGVEFNEYDLFSICMISDYLFLDRFNDSASFVRFEQCFGPLFSKIKNIPNKNQKFSLIEAFKEIVGPKKKYITFRRMIKAYLNWKKKLSENFSFNFFMNEVFNKMIKKKDEVVGQLIEGERIFSTRNCKNRKIITKFSVQTDESMNKINGFVIEYDEVFKAILCIKEKPNDIKLEINFDLFHTKDQLGSKFELDRDGISHVAGLYDENKKEIKFLIYKCRSGKTLYIGDNSDLNNEKYCNNITPFIFGSSKCQLKSLTIGLNKDNQLSYMFPKYQISTRTNENLDINFDSLNEEYLNQDLPKFEENNNLEENDPKKFFYPMIPDDQFVDKMSLMETKCGKVFNTFYTSYFEENTNGENKKGFKTALNNLKEGMKKLIENNLKNSNFEREEKLRSEKKRLVTSLIDYKKNNTNFEDVFVKLIRFKNKMNQKIENNEAKDNGNEEEFIEEEDEEEDKKDDMLLEKIKSGEYVVKEQINNINNKKHKDSTKNYITDSVNNYTGIDRQNYENKYNNHKIVEIKYTNKKKEPQDNDKK